MAVGVQQLQVIERLTATSTAPDPMVDVPGFLFGLKDLSAHQAPPLLFLPQQIPLGRKVLSPNKLFVQYFAMGACIHSPSA